MLTPDKQILVACHECDALQTIKIISPGNVARCRCCGARFFGNPKGGLDSPLALIISSLILFLIANLYPLLTLEIKGQTQTTTLSGASWSLYQGDMPILAAVVWITSVLGPGVVILSALYVLTAVRFSLRWPLLRPVLVAISRIHPWAMMDVFMLGILVTLVKLAGMADVVLGPGLYAYVALIVFFAGASTKFEAHLLWETLEKRR